MDPKRSLRDIASQYGTTYGTLQRHKTHITTAVQIAHKNGEIKQGKSAYDRFEELVAEAEAEFKSARGMERVHWFREKRSLFTEFFKLGMEAQRQAEKQVYSDVTPAVLAIINKEFEE